jgi:N-acetylglucosamine-1-phosphodiester alpha-N-acetylglucosaminidase
MALRTLSVAVALATAAAALATAAGADDVSKVAWATGPGPMTTRKWSGVFSTGKAFNATAAFVPDASLISVQLPYPDGCVNHAATSATAQQHACAYAVNAGFFDFPPTAACEGALVVNASLQQYPASAANLTGFGVSRATQSLVFGYTSPDTVAGYALDSLVTGRGWLLRRGRVYVNASREFDMHPGSKPPSFVTLWAPRTAAGAAANGTVILAVVDGIEGSSGPTLYEMAELMQSLGAVEAINLDGGGSSTAVLDGKLYNDAHCADTWAICERNVTSVVCAAY